MTAPEAAVVLEVGQARKPLALAPEELEGLPPHVLKELRLGQPRKVASMICARAWAKRHNARCE